MQRIDENTYIDDTLVTCAEYQLFIDEMREQGKYYQPDHWPSYQFPEGQALEPILGVRFSDAKDFCEWLTKRDGSDWHYRLPTGTEAKEYLLKHKQEPLPLGYWAENGSQLAFTWIGPVPANPRRISDKYAFEFARGLRPNEARYISRVLALDIDDTYSIFGSFTKVKDPNRDFDSEYANEPAGSLMRMYYFERLKFDRVRTIIPALDRALANAATLAIDYATAFDRNSGSDRAIALDRALANALDLARAFNIAITSDSDLKLDATSDRILYSDIKSDNHLYFDSADALMLYINIFTLQERIAGRSPAFEGIRLIKERIK